MKTFFLIIFGLISIIFVFNVQVDSFDPFLLNMDRSAIDFLQLPTTKIPSLADENTASMCPADTPFDKQIIEKLSTKFYQARRCLFERGVDENKNQFCPQEVKPSLHLEYNDLTNEPVLCGNSYRHQLHKIGFNFCGTVDVLIKFHDENNLKTPETFFKPRFFPIYEMCIDISNKRALWTKHNVMTPDIFHDVDKKKLQDENEPEPEISTDTLYSARFTFPENYFKKLKEKYANQNNEEKPSEFSRKLMKSTTKKKERFYKMDETFIVPREHIGLKMWRKTTNHYINVAPFWDVKSPIMAAVNKRIKKLAFKYHSQHQKLTVYTRIKTLTHGEHGHMKDSMDFRQNIWIKLLYEEKTKSAAWIVLQNTPMDTRELIPCSNPAPCETMEDWNKEGEEGNSFSWIDLSYVKCCHPSQAEIRSVFFMHLAVVYRLNLDQGVDES